MLQDEVLIFKFLPMDGLADIVITACEVTTLTPESWNNFMKSRTFITRFFYSAQSMKIFLLELFCKHLKGDVARRFNINRNTREHWS